MASKYDELAKALPELVGGLDNVSFFTHCVTRLRFDVKDKSKINLEQVKKAPNAKGAQWSGNQLQIIIGGGVEEAYDCISRATGLGDKKGGEDVPKEKKFRPAAIMEFIAASITPVVTLLIGTGMIKVLMLLGTMAGLISADGSTYQVLSFVSDSAFYFLPVFIGYAASAKLGMNPYMGALLGAMLLHPNFISMVGSESAISVFGLPIRAVTYSSSMFPVILMVWIASYVERFLRKHTPEVLRSILVPFVTILVMTPVGLCVLAPLGDILGVYFSNAIIWLYETFGFIGVALFTGLHPLLVMTGMHHGIGPYLVASLADPGFEALASPATVIDNINLGVASLAVAIKTKSNRVRANAIPASITAAVGGVTEPALFGVVLQYRRVLISTMAGGFVGGAVAGLAKCVSYAFAGSYGVFGLFTFVGEDGMANLYWMILAVAAGAVVTFLCTLALFKDNKEDLEVTESIVDKSSSEILMAPITGMVKPLEECPDKVFAEGTLGKGVVIEPLEGKVYAPCDGVVSAIFDTLHAIGIQADHGAEVLIHVGMDTVNLKGQGFTAHVKSGDRIKTGQLLLEFDMDWIRSKGLSLITPVIVSNPDHYQDMKEKYGNVTHGEEMIHLI
ncbi:hypothetical protein GPL15_05195 [Clostridium sp. MCC353]|uniref:beta-glucoside-specific PTS transporter subunit IIABC n=1 Tax=Clostridium sp. MCC353 TaxID=2592646 RepID=UPI001C03405C|nr:beta-glucoside-specific PTS transporter subunit IIABC [Clostridium sp. MCC353]MBT9775899.1 hypothetical protein [Clostridium sp. MCC353]